MVLIEIAALILSLSAEQTYTVCEILASPEAFEGRSVKVKGIVLGGLEGAWLKGENCSEKFYVGAHNLTNGLYLSARSDFGRSIVRNDTHIKMIEGGARNRTSSISGPMIATYSGVVETRQHWDVVTYPSGEVRLLGFGHDNAFRAQLVVEDLVDLLERRKTPGRARKPLVVPGTVTKEGKPSAN